MSRHKQSSKSPLLAALAKALNKAMQLHEADMPADGYDELVHRQRRQFLKSTGKAAAAVTMLGAMQACQKALHEIAPVSNDVSAARKTDKRVVIIGAGMAGLHAAWLLKNAGCLAPVYEGSYRTGGRMYTAKNIMGPGLTTELGGEFIDSIHKDMLQLVRTFGLELIDVQSPSEQVLQSQAYFIGGRHYTEQEVIEAFLPFAEIIKRDQQRMSVIITADSYGPFDAELDNLSIAGYFDRIGLQGWLRTILDVAYVTEYGLPIEQQTALNFLWLISPRVNQGTFQIFGASDERYKIRGGNQQLVDLLAAQVSGQIQTGHELLAIRQQAGGQYVLTFATGKTKKDVTADIVLVTIPFTKLRSVEVQPAWPEWKRKAIFDIGYGNNSKLMLAFNSPYWRNLGYAGYYFTDNILQSGWDNSQLQGGTACGLTIYTGAQPAINVGRGSIAMQAGKHLPLLEALYPGAIAQYNGRAERFVWPTYPWTLCSYTCFHPGQYTTIAGNEIKPVGNIFFAGEHCSYDYQGYMNGAAETGRRAAEAISKLL